VEARFEGGQGPEGAVAPYMEWNYHSCWRLLISTFSYPAIREMPYILNHSFRRYINPLDWDVQLQG